MEKVIGHLVDEERCIAAINTCLLYELLSELSEEWRVQLSQYFGIARLGCARLVSTSQSLSEIQNVMELHCAIYLRMGCQNLLEQRGSGSG